MAYAQWVSIKVSAKLCDLTIKNVVQEWGKFYKGEKDNEVDPKNINNTMIKNENSYVISACGRENSPSGTEGSFDLYDGETHIGSYLWDCPWGSKTNTSTWNSDNSNYVTQVTGANLDSGALGNVNITVVKIT